MSQAPETAPAGAGAHARPAGWRRLGQSRPVVVAAGVLTALAIAYYFYGPPWYLNRTKGATWIGYQEDVFLSGFQGMSHGAVPYIGAGANQYGPGAEFLTYWYMRHVATFSVVGFREAWAFFFWVGASILFVVLFLAFGYVRGLIATLLSVLVYPALHLLGFMPSQPYTGFFGWPNPMRYVGAIALVLLLPGAVRRYPARRGLVAAGVLGLLFGVTSYIGQENLLAGIVGAVVVSALLALTGSASMRSVIRTLLAACAGFLVVWVPILAYYAVNGALTRFLYLYFLFPQAVADGYTDTPYGGIKPHPDQIAMDAPWRTFYYGLPVLLAIVALLVVVQFRPFRVAQRWSRERITLAATVVAAILLYQGALLRADSEHLFGTELVVPALVIMAATALPRLVGVRHRMALLSGGAVILMAFLLLLPYSSVRLSSIKAWAEAPLQDRQSLAAEAAPSTPVSIAGQRVGAGLAGAKLCCQRSAETMASFVQVMQHLHQIVGDRTTYVQGIPDGYPGLVYFVADLTPAPTPLDFSTMVLTDQEERAYMADFRASVMPRTYAIVTNNLHAPEVVDFRSAYRGLRTVTLTFNGSTCWVLLRPQA